MNKNRIKVKQNKFENSQKTEKMDVKNNTIFTHKINIYFETVSGS